MAVHGSKRRKHMLVMACGSVLLLASFAHAQDQAITVNPNRPTFSTPALTTQVGVAELEWGVQQSYLHVSSQAFSTPTLLKLGLVKDFELRVSSNGWLDLSQPHSSSSSGFADLALGAQWCFTHDGPFGTDDAIQLTRKLPTASARSGLGSGVADTTLAVFFSRDFGPNHADLNFLTTWLGRPRSLGGGTALQPAASLSVSHNLSDAWSFGGEVYAIGGTALAEHVVSTLWYVAYKPVSRVVFDTGVDVGLSHGAQRYSLVAGVTYGIGRFRTP